MRHPGRRFKQPNLFLCHGCHTSAAGVMLPMQSDSQIHRLIILVETVAGNRLTSATWARLKVAPNLMQLAAGHSAVVTLRMIQILRAFAVRHSIKLLRIDDEPFRIYLWLFIAMPSRLFGIPGHAKSDRTASHQLGDRLAIIEEVLG